MPAEFPQVTRAADRRPRYRPGRLASGIRLQSRLSDQQIDLADLETCHLDIEGEIELGELAQLLAKKLFVPGGDFGEPVVGDRKGPRLGRGQMLETDGRHFRSPALRGGDEA